MMVHNGLIIMVMYWTAQMKRISNLVSREKTGCDISAQHKYVVVCGLLLHKILYLKCLFSLSY